MAEIEDVWNANKDDFHTEREWFELGVMARDDEIRERDARIAKLEQVVEAARTICDATYLHEMINAATDIRKALAELEGE